MARSKKVFNISTSMESGDVFGEIQTTKLLESEQTIILQCYIKQLAHLNNALEKKDIPSRQGSQSVILMHDNVQCYVANAM